MLIEAHRCLYKDVISLIMLDEWYINSITKKKSYNNKCEYVREDITSSDYFFVQWNSKFNCPTKNKMSKTKLTFITGSPTKR